MVNKKKTNQDEPQSESWQIVLINKLFDKRNAWVLALLLTTNGGQALVSKFTDSDDNNVVKEECGNFTEAQIESLAQCPDIIKNIIINHSTQMSELISRCGE